MIEKVILQLIKVLKIVEGMRRTHTKQSADVCHSFCVCVCVERVRLLTVDDILRNNL